MDRSLKTPEKNWDRLDLLVQEEMLEHLSKCDGFLYLVSVFREESRLIRQRLLVPQNTREQDLELKYMHKALLAVEARYDELLAEVQDRVKNSEAPINLEEEL